MKWGKQTADVLIRRHFLWKSITHSFSFFLNIYVRDWRDVQNHPPPPSFPSPSHFLEVDYTGETSFLSEWKLQTKGIVNGGSMGAIPESLSGIGSRVTNAFRDHSMPRAGSLPAAQLQGDLLHAADDITTNMGTLLKELDQGQLHIRSRLHIVNVQSLKPLSETVALKKG